VKHIKIIDKPIEVVTYYDKEGVIMPIRFRILENEEHKVIKINKIFQRDRYKLDGKDYIIFRCQNAINGAAKIMEIKYEVASCLWKLYKM
jgi:hypothetical protein